jgi:hypothetical protein
MKRDFVYERIRSPLRSLLCKFDIHDYECAEIGNNGNDYAILYCFYCGHRRHSRALTKDKVDVSYKEWLTKIGKVSVESTWFCAKTLRSEK